MQVSTDGPFRQGLIEECTGRTERPTRLARGLTTCVAYTTKHHESPHVARVSTFGMSQQASWGHEYEIHVD